MLVSQEMFEYLEMERTKESNDLVDTECEVEVEIVKICRLLIC